MQVKDKKLTSEEKSLIRSYATAMFMLALLDEWNKIERVGVVAKIYNTIVAKHKNFHKQIHEVNNGKKKKYSRKCELFVLASSYSIVTWEKIINQTDNETISINTTIHNLFRIDAENFHRIYSLDLEVFKKLNNKQSTATLQSCRVGRLLLESLEDIVNKNSSD